MPIELDKPSIDRNRRVEGEINKIPPAGLGPVTLVSSDQELNAASTAEGLAVADPAAHP